MLKYVEIDGIDVTDYLLKYTCFDEWRLAISIIDIEFSTAILDYVTPSLSKNIVVKRGFASVEEDYVFNGQIIQRKPSADRVVLSCKGQLIEAIKAGRTKSWDKDIDTEAGVGSEIMKSLCDHSGLSYSSTSIVSTGTTDSDKLVKFVQNDEDDFDRMNELSQIYNNRVIRFDNKTGYVHFEPAGYTTYPQPLVVGVDIPAQIKWKENMEQMINKVKILGATVYDKINPAVFAGPASDFTLSKTPEDTEVRQDNAAGALYVRGQKSIGTLGTDFDYYVDVEKKKIVFATDKSNIWIRYGAQVPMPITLKNQTSIDQYGGPDKTPHFKRFSYTDIKDIADAEKRGRAILNKYSTPFVEAQNVPIKDTVLETYGFIKVGDLINITDDFSGETTSAFVKIIQKTYPDPMDKITIGDEIWRTEDWQTTQMEKLNLLFNELNKNEDILTSVFDLNRTTTYGRRYMMRYTRDTSPDYLWGNTNWTWGTAPAIWQLAYTNAIVLSGITQGNNIYVEKFYDEDFKGTPFTSDWNTTSGKVYMSTRTDYQEHNTVATSGSIFLGNKNIVTATLNCTENKFGNDRINYFLSVDGRATWHQVTKGTPYTFAVQGNDLSWMAVFLGNGGINTYFEDMRITRTVVV